LLLLKVRLDLCAKCKLQGSELVTPSVNEQLAFPMQHGDGKCASVRNVPPLQPTIHSVPEAETLKRRRRRAHASGRPLRVDARIQSTPKRSLNHPPPKRGWFSGRCCCFPSFFHSSQSAIPSHNLCNSEEKNRKQSKPWLQRVKFAVSSFVSVYPASIVDTGLAAYISGHCPTRRSCDLYVSYINQVSRRLVRCHAVRASPPPPVVC
jgi:hypothetical protein